MVGEAFGHSLPGTSGGSGAMELIQETVVTGAAVSSIVFSGIPATYRHLRVVASLRSTRATADDAIYARLNGDAAASYSDVWHSNVGGSNTAGTDLAQTGGYVGRVPAANASASRFGALVVDLPDYLSSNHKQGVAETGYTTSDVAGGQTIYRTGFVWRSVAAVSSLTFYGTGGNLVVGSVVSLYGIT